MQNNRREARLKVAVGIVLGLFVLDRMVLTPAVDGWKAQGARIDALREKVARGKQLLERENAIRGHWAGMLRANLADDPSSAEGAIFKAIGKWKLENPVGFSSLTKEWHSHEEGFDTCDFRATAAGDQASLGKLLYEIETDPLPARIDNCEISTRDAKGRQLTLSVQFSFVRMKGLGGNP